MALGYADHEQAPVEEMLACTARIIRAVSLPVSVDLEAGYGLAPGEVARRLVVIGTVGLNLEDTDHRGISSLVPAQEQNRRLAALKAAAHSLCVDLVLNAQLGVFMRREGELKTQLAEGTRRARLYREPAAIAFIRSRRAILTHYA